MDSVNRQANNAQLSSVDSKNTKESEAIKTTGSFLGKACKILLKVKSFLKSICGNKAPVTKLSERTARNVGSGKTSSKGLKQAGSQPGNRLNDSASITSLELRAVVKNTMPAPENKSYEESFHKMCKMEHAEIDRLINDGKLGEAHEMLSNESLMLNGAQATELAISFNEALENNDDQTIDLGTVVGNIMPAPANESYEKSFHRMCNMKYAEIDGLIENGKFDEAREILSGKSLLLNGLQATELVVSFNKAHGGI